jgi:phenylpropionate dioxygenase-like ring-hydroxylating dioxygenase large terminal subunit
VTATDIAKDGAAAVLAATGVAVNENAPIGSAITTVGSSKGSPTRVPVERYISPEFAQRELQKMWPRTWQIACSVDHVAEPGDYYEYRCGPYSVLIVRSDDGVLRAFQNVCRHRGNLICEGVGNGLTELRCGYHNWTWDLKGKLREVPSRKGFGALRNDEFPLYEARVDTWGPIVFVNLDLGAMPLMDYLEGVPDDIAWIGFDDYRCRAAVTVPVEANWKVVADGFSETYHVQGLHREMIASMDDIDAPQQVWGHTSKSSQPYGVASPRFRKGLDDQTIWESFIVTQGGRMGVEEVCPMPELAPGQTLQDVIADGIKRVQAERGVDRSRFTSDEMLRLHQYNLFPNSTVLITPDLLSIICARPGKTPDDCDMVMLNFEPCAPGAPRSQPFDATVPPGQADFGYVINADVEVAPRVQRGLHQPGMTHMALSSEECRVINTQRNLERYLGIEPSELTGGPVRD